MVSQWYKTAKHTGQAVKRDALIVDTTHVHKAVKPTAKPRPKR